MITGHATALLAVVVTKVYTRPHRLEPGGAGPFIILAGADTTGPSMAR
ncbi:MAG: hypothetical protein WBP18_05085 [Paracoccaceae bacterium]